MCILKLKNVYVTVEGFALFSHFEKIDITLIIKICVEVGHVCALLEGM
jgi:hypothetical protein